MIYPGPSIYAAFIFLLMAITVGDADKAAVLASAGVDLRFLFDRNGVDADFAVKLSIGITTVELFAVFTKDQGDLEHPQVALRNRHGQYHLKGQGQQDRRGVAGR